MANTQWNPADKGAGITLSGGNLIATNNNNVISGVRAVDSHAVGKFYWEYTCNTVIAASSGVGFVGSAADITFAINTLTPSSGVRGTNGTIYTNAVASGTNVGTLAAGIVVAVALDCTARLVWYREGAAGLWNASGTANPATGVGGISLTSLGAGIQLYPWVCPTAINNAFTANFGDSAFTGVVPSGFTAGFTSGGDVVASTQGARVMVLA